MPRTDETAEFRLNHTMLRVKDPDVSLHFYQDILGMDLLAKNNRGNFTLYFLGYDHDGISKLPAEEKALARFDREGILELTHIHGTETNNEFKGYASGNEEPTLGFGHIALAVKDIHAACERFEKLDVPFKKRLGEDPAKHIAFILDPDGYWIEIVSGSSQP